jgi:hypothetical protein
MKTRRREEPQELLAMMMTANTMTTTMLCTYCLRDKRQETTDKAVSPHKEQQENK